MDTDYSDLKVGDEVLIHYYGSFANDDNIGKVTRLTKTQIIVNDVKYRRETGSRIGSRSSWGGSFISELSEETKIKILHRQYATLTKNRLEKFNMLSLSNEQLDVINNVLGDK